MWKSDFVWFCGSFCFGFRRHVLVEGVRFTYKHLMKSTQNQLTTLLGNTGVLQKDQRRQKMSSLRSTFLNLSMISHNQDDLRQRLQEKSGVNKDRSKETRESEDSQR